MVRAPRRVMMPWGKKTWDENGFSEQHGAGSLKDAHEGSIENCSAPECQWPQEGIYVLWPVDGRRTICSIIDRDDKVARVKLADGSERIGPRDWAREIEWGSYCPHGIQVTEAVPAEHTCKDPKPPCDLTDKLGHLCIDHQPACPACYPGEQKILPWPCPVSDCTEAEFDRGQREMENEYYKSMWDEYYGNR